MDYPISYYEHGNRKQQKIALTFDDGPNPPCTDQVIEILDDKGIRGTFFVIGKWVERWPETTKHLASKHVVGNHGYSHTFGVYDLAESDAIITSVTGLPTRFMRAPYFDCNCYCNLPLPMIDSTIRLHSDVQSLDFKECSPQSIINSVLKNRHLTGGSVILLHDGSQDDCQRLVRPLPMTKALPRLIDELWRLEFELVGIDEMEFIDPSTQAGSFTAEII